MSIIVHAELEKAALIIDTQFIKKSEHVQLPKQNYIKEKKDLKNPGTNEKLKKS